MPRQEAMCLDVTRQAWKTGRYLTSVIYFALLFRGLAKMAVQCIARTYNDALPVSAANEEHNWLVVHSERACEHLDSYFTEMKLPRCP